MPSIRRLIKRYSSTGEYAWYIDKRLKRFGRLCEAIGTSGREEAERYLLHRMHEIREMASRPCRISHGPQKGAYGEQTGSSECRPATPAQT